MAAAGDDPPGDLAAQLGVPAAIASVGLSEHVLSSAVATAIVAAGVVSLGVCTLGLELLARRPGADGGPLARAPV